MSTQRNTKYSKVTDDLEEVATTMDTLSLNECEKGDQDEIRREEAEIQVSVLESKLSELLAIRESASQPGRDCQVYEGSTA